MNKTQATKSTNEGGQFRSNRFSEIQTVEQWIAAFPSRYSSLPASIAKAFATRDMRAAK